MARMNLVSTWFTKLSQCVGGLELAKTSPTVPRTLSQSMIFGKIKKNYLQQLLNSPPNLLPLGKNPSHERKNTHTLGRTYLGSLRLLPPSRATMDVIGRATAGRNRHLEAHGRHWSWMARNSRPFGRPWDAPAWLRPLLAVPAWLHVAEDGWGCLSPAGSVWQAVTPCGRSWLAAGRLWPGQGWLMLADRWPGVVVASLLPPVHG
jgi:hypothetical protein